MEHAVLVRHRNLGVDAGILDDLVQSIKERDEVVVLRAALQVEADGA